MAERRMEALRFIRAYATAGYGLPDNTISVTNHRYHVKCMPYTEERLAATTLKIPKWVDLSLPWKWRIYGFAPYNGVSVVIGVSITAFSIGDSQSVAAGAYTKMTIPSRGSSNIWGGDSADVSPYLKAKTTVPSNSPQASDQAVVQIKRFSFDANDDLNDSWSFIGCSLFCPVRDQYDTLDWTGI